MNFTKFRLWCESFLFYILEGPYSRLGYTLTEICSRNPSIICGGLTFTNLALFWEILVANLIRVDDAMFRNVTSSRNSMCARLTEDVLIVKKIYPFLCFSKYPTLFAEISFVKKICQCPTPLEIEKALVNSS